MRSAKTKPAVSDRYKELAELNGFTVAEALQQGITLEELKQIENYNSDPFETA